MNWIKISDKLPESEQEVLVYHEFGGEGIIEILTYFTKGTVIDHKFNNAIKNKEIRLMDSILNPANEIKAELDGFYMYDNVTGECAWRKHRDTITHWIPLP